MTIAKGVAVKLAYAKESAWGTAATGSGTSKYLRRVSSEMNLEKDSYESNEIRTDYQVADFRHGVRRATGSVNGELSAGTYADFLAAVVARDFTAGAALTGLGIDIAAGSGGLWTITRAAGDYLADGLKVGQVVQLTAGTGLDAANTNNNALVVGVTALVATVKPLSPDFAFVADAGVTAATLTVVGKETYAPLTNHTDDSFTVEKWFANIAQSEVFTGVKVGSAKVALPASGLVTVDLSLMGKDMAQVGTSQYFTAATAAGTEGVFAAVNGAMTVNGAVVALITSMDFSVERNLENLSVVGSNSVADIVTGRIKATGTMSVYFINAQFRDYFDDETPVAVSVALTASNAKDADVVSFTFPKVKLGSFTKDDKEGALTASASFTALLKETNALGIPETTIHIQDTSL